MAKKCVHKGCGKVFEDEAEPCVYHPGPPVFHEGQKGWKCCKPRVLTFDEFLIIPPCTTGTHSEIDDTPAEEPKPSAAAAAEAPEPTPAHDSSVNLGTSTPSRLPTQAAPTPTRSPAPPPEDEDDDPSLPIPDGAACKRKACSATYDAATGRGEGVDESCVHHPGVPIFHEGSKGYSCCKRRVLEFDEFMKIEGCATKDRHLFVGSKKKDENAEDIVESVRSDFYQTPTTVIASLFLKKIDKDQSTVDLRADGVALDLRTADRKRHTADLRFFAPVDPATSSYKIMGTKLELELRKADGQSWPVLRVDDPRTGEIIQVGRAGRV